GLAGSARHAGARRAEAEAGGVSRHGCHEQQWPGPSPPRHRRDCRFWRGALLLVGTIRAAGAAAVLLGIRRLGPGFIIVCALGGIRGILRTVAWRLCLDDASRLKVRHAFSAYRAGGSPRHIPPFGWLL